MWAKSCAGSCAEYHAEPCSPWRTPIKPTHPIVTLADVRSAQAALAGHIEPTPFLHSRTLSQILGAEIWLKFENLQFTASFKERGAYNRLRALTPAERKQGVIAVSAGNHAQGVAYHAKALGVPTVIVMPAHTPTVKVANTQRFGAEVVLYGEAFDDARERGMALAAERGLTLIHPYDDAAIIAGQGTVALEMLAAQPELDALIVPVGGGGLISGMAVAAKAIKPDIRIIGVQSSHFAAMHDTLYPSKAAAAPAGGRTIAEGIAVKSPGTLTAELVRRWVDDMVLVDEAALEHAIVMLLEIEKTVVEGAGAAALAALLGEHSTGQQRFHGQRLGLVLSGGNIDPLVLAELIGRGMVQAGRLARIQVNLTDLPGTLATVTRILADAHANISAVHHQRAFTTLPVQAVEVDFVLQTRGPDHIRSVLQRLNDAGFSAKNYAH